MSPKDSRQPSPPQSSKFTIPKFATEDIMQGGKETVRLHGASEYRLRITSRDKPILTK